MTEAINGNKNILWIDYAKFLAIFLVIFGHTLQNLNLTDLHYFRLLWAYIYLFHMPLFFIITGFLYKQKDKQSNNNKILFALIIPYICYQLLYLPFAYGNYIISTHSPLFSTFVKFLLGILMGDFVNSQYSLAVCGTCWFIMSMIQIRFLLNYLKLNTKNIILLSLGSILLLKFLILHKIDLFFCLDNTLMAIPYVMIGYLCKQLYDNKMNLHAKNNIFKLVGVRGKTLP